MISPFPEDIEIVLASGSPRRQEIISQLFVSFECIPSAAEDAIPLGMPVDEVAEHLARQKSHVDYALQPHQVLVTADTVVIYKDQIFGKPKDKIEARDMLRQLSGQRHSVITGVCLKTLKKQQCFSVTTEIQFATLSESIIQFYIDNYDVLDKAGAYGIQDWIGMVGVERIEGNYYNVVGLPVSQLIEEINKIYA